MTLLDYCLHAGSENVVIYFRDNLYVIRTLKEFQYIDKYGRDQGANVRQKAKDITNLLSDDTRLREERMSRARLQDRMASQTAQPYVAKMAFFHLLIVSDRPTPNNGSPSIGVSSQPQFTKLQPQFAAVLPQFAAFGSHPLNLSCRSLTTWLFCVAYCSPIR